MNILCAFLNVRSLPEKRRGLFKPHMVSIQFRIVEYFKTMHLALSSGIKYDRLLGCDAVWFRR